MRRLDIDPLDKPRWDRIERSLRDRLEREPVTPAPPRTRPVVAIVLAGVAAVAIGGIAWERLRPSVQTHEAPAVTRVETQGTPAHVEFGEARLEVSAHSSARIEGTDTAGIVVSLDQGAIECEVPPRRGRPAFIVHAGDVNVRVIGTHFRMARAGVGADVTVERGTVEVEWHGATTLVHEGSAWPVASVDKPEATDVAGGPPPIPSASTAKPVASAGATQVAVVPPVVTLSSRERYERALTLEASEPEAALAIYREVAAGDDSWAMNALYAEARLEHERGYKDLARKRLAEYLQRYPSGPNANDARELSAKVQ